MDDSELITSLNTYLSTQDNTPITSLHSFYTQNIRDSLVLHNRSMADLMVQAYVGRYFMRSGERLVVSLANGRINRREMYPEIKNTLFEMMIVVAMATLTYVLVKTRGD